MFADAETISTEEVACGLCGKREARFYAESYDYEYETCSNRWEFHECAGCGNVYLNPRPARSALSTIYPRNYYSYSYEDEVSPIAQRAKALLDRRRFAGIQEKLGRPIGRYLDIGCGSGRYLRAVRSTGVDASEIFGIELDEGVVTRLKAEGFQAQSVPFEDAVGLEPATFDLITLFSVLEHMAEPRQALERIRSLLTPNGLVVFEVPNIASTNAGWFKRRYWGGYHTPRHWNLFGPSTVRWLAKELDFAVEHIAMTPGHAFWLWSLHHYTRYHLGADKLGRRLVPTKCLPGVAAITPIDMLRGLWSGRTDNMLVFLRPA